MDLIGIFGACYAKQSTFSDEARRESDRVNRAGSVA